MLKHDVFSLLYEAALKLRFFPPDPHEPNHDCSDCDRDRLAIAVIHVANMPIHWHVSDMKHGEIAAYVHTQMAEGMLKVLNTKQGSPGEETHG